MSKKAIKSPKIAIVLALVIFGLFFGYLLFVILVIRPDSANWRLYSQVHVLAKEVKQYKQKTGFYPDNLLQIRDTDKLCTEIRGLQFCNKIHYKVSGDKQQFRMAIKSLFNQRVLYYHPEISMTVEEARTLSAEDKKKLSSKYGLICYHCAAEPQWTKYFLSRSSNGVIYKEDPKIFGEYPELWPEL